MIRPRTKTGDEVSPVFFVEYVEKPNHLDPDNNHQGMIFHCRVCGGNGNHWLLLSYDCASLARSFARDHSKCVVAARKLRTLYDNSFDRLADLNNSDPAMDPL